MSRSGCGNREFPIADVMNRDRWTDLVSRTKPLQNTLLLISYRTNDEQQPEVSMKPSVLIHTRSFSLPVLQEMCLK